MPPNPRTRKTPKGPQPLRGHSLSKEHREITDNASNSTLDGVLQSAARRIVWRFAVSPELANMIAAAIIGYREI